MKLSKLNRVGTLPIYYQLPTLRTTTHHKNQLPDLGTIIELKQKF